MNALLPSDVVQLKGLLSSPKISTNAVSGFSVAANPTTKGVDVKFSVVLATGIASILLFRAATMDRGQATLLQSWSPVPGSYTWADTDSALQQQTAAYYWLQLNATGVNGTPLTIGPQSISLAPATAAPLGPSAISASHGSASAGIVTVTLNAAWDGEGTLRVEVSGYKGNGAYVAVAQGSTTPLQFTLQATGETVTLRTTEFSAAGIPGPATPGTRITLSSTATVPATPLGMQVEQIATGNQVTFSLNRDGATSYQLFRGQRGSGFLGATLLATLTTGEYLDTTGLTGDWQYFLEAVSSSGTSAPSPGANPPVFYTSSAIPSNVPSNTSNTATIDSVDAGSSVLVRIYGPGGVGTSYNRLTGFGSLARPNGTISGLAYSTTYVILWTGTNFAAVTSYPATLPDQYEYVGGILTTAATGTAGSGATATAVVNSAGNLIQVNPTAYGSGYSAATVNIAGGGGSGAQVTANLEADKVVSYTVTNGGSGYMTAPTVTVVPGTSSGTVGGGGSTGNSSGSRTGCVEEGTEVEVPEGTLEERLPCSEWIALDTGSGEMFLHPDTLVSVFKRASELTSADRIEVKGGFWRKGVMRSVTRNGIKIKRTCPGGVYLAGPDRVRLHNFKPDLS